MKCDFGPLKLVREIENFVKDRVRGIERIAILLKDRQFHGNQRNTSRNKELRGIGVREIDIPLYIDY